MIANTSAVCLNYYLDAHEMNVIKETSHTVCPRFNYPFSFFLFSTVQRHLALLLAAAMVTALDSQSHNLASERSSIESTYELTKYLEYQLKEIKDVYVSMFCCSKISQTKTVRMLCIRVLHLPTTRSYSIV